MSWIFINHYKSAVFGCTRCHPYHMLLHEYCLPRFVLSVLKHVQIPWDEFFTMRCAPRCCTMSYALVQAPQEIWWLMSFDDWAVSVFWRHWHRLRLLLGDQVLLVYFVDSCAVFWTTYWLICLIWLHEKFISPKWTFPGTRFTCDDFNWGVDAIYDYCKGFRLKVECYFIVFRIPYKYCTTDGVLPDYACQPC